MNKIKIKRLTIFYGFVWQIGLNFMFARHGLQIDLPFSFINFSWEREN